MSHDNASGADAANSMNKTPGANVAAELLAKQVFDVGFVIDHKDVGAHFLCPPITGTPDEATRRNAAELGAAGLLTKPIDFGMLRQEIDERLQQAA
jgi:hypothetical protein